MKVIHTPAFTTNPESSKIFTMKIAKCYFYFCSILKNHPSENMVVSSSIMEHVVVAWNTETSKQLGVFAGHQNVVTGIDFHPSSNQMVT